MKDLIKILIFILIVLSPIYADSNGIWTYSEDIRAGIFGADENLDSLDFYGFNNIVYFNVGLVASNIDVNGNISMGGTLVSGEVPWARLSNHPSIIAGSGLVGGGALSTNRSLSLNSSILDGSHYDLRFVNRAGDTMTGALQLQLASGTSNNLIIGSEGHMISQNSNRLVLYPNRAGSGSFQIRSHNNGVDYRTDFEIDNFGNSRILGDLRLDGILTHGTVPWARLSGYPTIIAGTGLTGGGVLSTSRTINLNTNIVDGSAFDSRFVNREGDSMSGTLNMNNNQITNIPTPTQDNHAANKAYVDSIISTSTEGLASFKHHDRIVRSGNTMPIITVNGGMAKWPDYIYCGRDSSSNIAPYELDVVSSSTVTYRSHGGSSTFRVTFNGDGSYRDRSSTQLCTMSIVQICNVGRCSN